MRVSNQSFLTRISVFTLTRDSTVEYPEYRLSTNYDIHLSAPDFTSLNDLKSAISEKTNAGFLSSQFFRVAFLGQFTTSGTFLTTSTEVSTQFLQQTDKIFDLVVVRYTKVQSYQLKNLISQEEYRQLDALLRTKRTYAKKDISDDEIEPVQIKFFDQFQIKGAKSQIISEILNSPASRFYGPKMVEEWGQRITNQEHNSVWLPPSEFPLVQNGENGGYLTVSVSARIYGVCMKFAGILNSE
ncbi:hypothetical protein SS50377_22869 [Spironucleus salmonicida]|uniref:Uncharacterized protein n=1 Tax=Spironucleus salmonicida TaxID=348837 RepID=V6LYD8_9EUKA|nr:hypothetical protein SS50377_22869 [Spironucleus salmonicida]|eukprot:EST48721.1 hypothetical protein SS50377_11037 [Spironucleus salmonicida]